jgi:glucuronyl esterase-like protein/cellulose/xylan binding protein with CBM9 domain
MTVITPASGPLRAIFVALMLASAPALARDASKPTNNVLSAQFTAASIDVDGKVDAAWSKATPVPIAHAYNPAMTDTPDTACPIAAELRALWNGGRLYLLVSVTDPLVSTAGSSALNRDGVEFWIDHFNDKRAKFEEDDGTFTITAAPADMTANRAQNDIYGNVSSRYLGGYASAVQSNAAGAGYTVEIAWALGEHARANGSTLGLDVGINEADASNTRRCRVFWNTASSERTTNDNREWGTVVLAGYDGSSPMQADKFMLNWNVTKADRMARADLWQDVTALNAALERTSAVINSTNQREIDQANLELDTAIRGLRRKGPYPDPYDLPEIEHLPDPFRFFNGRKVKSRADWDKRREEIKDLMQYYEFGRKPQKPALTVVSHNAPPPRQTRHLDIGVSQAARTGTFEALLALPTPEQAAASGKSAPFPVIVSLDREMRFDSPIYLNAGYAVLSLPTRRIHSDDVAHTGAVFDLYPYDVTAGQDIGSLTGWAWGASRALDSLESLLANDPTYRVEVNGRSTPLLDMRKVAITGFSRWGKGALLAGMLDERFQVTHAGASGSGGAAPYRFMPFGNQYAWGSTAGSEVLGDHMRHQTHNSNEMARRFLNDTFPSSVQGRMYVTKTHGYGERMPFDHHLEIAAIAPRAVLISNTNDDYGNNAEGDAIGYQGALPVFKFLGAADKLALDIYMGGGGHSLNVAQQHNFVRFLDYVLFGVPLPKSAPPDDATQVPTDVRLRWDPYLTGAEGGKSVYDVYYGGLQKMMPWRARAPSR